VPREFHLDKTHFFSFFLNTMSCYLKCLYGNLFNVNETQMKLPLRLTLIHLVCARRHHVSTPPDLRPTCSQLLATHRSMTAHTSRHQLARLLTAKDGNSWKQLKNSSIIFYFYFWNTKTKIKMVKSDTKMNANLRNIKNSKNEPIRADLRWIRLIYETQYEIPTRSTKCITKYMHGSSSSTYNN